MVIKLILMAFIVVYVVDISGAIDSLKSGLKWLLTKGKMKDNNYRLKPIDCSLCSVWWCGLIFLLCTGNFTLTYIAFVALLSAFADIMKSTILLFRDIIITIINLIYKGIDKLS